MEAGSGCNVPAAAVPAGAPHREAAGMLDVNVVYANRPFGAGNVITVFDPGARPLMTLACGEAGAHFAVAPGQYQVMASLGRNLRSEMTRVAVRPEGAHVTLTLTRPPGAGAEVAPDVL